MVWHIHGNQYCGHPSSDNTFCCGASKFYFDNSNKINVYYTIDNAGYFDTIHAKNTSSLYIL